MKRFLVLLGVMSASALAAQSIGAQLDVGIAVPSAWRITRVVPAPWAAAEHSQVSISPWVGKTVQFESNAVKGPGVLNCDHATLEKTSYAADALFQGGLPKGADAAAQALGIAHLPVSGVRLDCSTGSFEFHSADSGTLLLGLDNQILTLSRSPGTSAPADSPEGRIQQFLEVHFNGEMGFTAERTKAYRNWFSKSLESAIVTYLAKPIVEDEVPAINGDPFTDSQSYPTRFSVGKAKISSHLAEVPIRFSDASSQREITYLLLRLDGKWQLDDVRFEDGETLTKLMQ